MGRGEFPGATTSPAGAEVPCRFRSRQRVRPLAGLVAVSPDPCRHRDAWAGQYEEAAKGRRTRTWSLVGRRHYLHALGCVRVCRRALLGLAIIHGTLNSFEDTWVGDMRAKGGALFELGYVAAIAVVIWLAFKVFRRYTRQALAKHEERQMAARRVRREAAKAANADGEPDLRAGAHA